MSFKLFLAGLALSLMAGAAQAQPFDSPKALLESAYSSYQTEIFPDDPLALYSEGLKALFREEEARTPEGEVGALDFDPFINGQDYAGMHDFKVGEPAPVAGDPDTMTDRVTFLADKRPEMIDFVLVKENGGWLIDDIIHPAHDGEEGWRLSEILAGDPLLN